MIIVDGTNMVFGRLASKIAKNLMQGEEVHVINAEKIVISGVPENVVADYMQKRSLQNKGSPEHSPKWPKIPHLLVRRMIRGMLPFKKAKGRTAFRNLKVYAKDPKLSGEIITFPEAKNKGFAKSISIGELCKHLGANW